MKSNNYNLVQLALALDGMASKKLPIKLSYAIVKNRETLRTLLDPYEKALAELIDRFKDKSTGTAANGLPIFSEDVQPEFDAELEDLLNLNVEYDPFTIKYDFDKYDDNKFDALTPMELAKISFIFDKEEEIKEDDIQITVE